jgi:hypothetical protein
MVLVRVYTVTSHIFYSLSGHIVFGMQLIRLPLTFEIRMSHRG